MEPNAKRFTFVDRHGDTWDVTLTLGAAMRIDASDFSRIYRGEVSMTEPSQDLLSALTSRTDLIAAFVWAIVQPAAEAREPACDENAFADALDGAAVKRMKEAFWGSLCDFFPDLASALSQTIRARVRAQAKVTKMIQAESETIQNAVDHMVDKNVRAAFDQLKTALGTVSITSEPSPG